MANEMTLRGVRVGVGDVVRLHIKVLEGEKERVQVYEGMIIGIRGRETDQTFTIRKIAAGGIGVERIFRLESPWIVKVEIKKVGHVRRAKLHYVRAKSAKQVSQISASIN
jgi:large subunit ribosomal protein L19